jgi:hypothetical protein
VNTTCIQLYQRGLIAALAPAGAHDADIIVFSPEMSVGSMVQVKTRPRGSDGGRQMSERHGRIAHDRLLHAIVDLEPAEPSVYVVPSASVVTSAPGEGTTFGVVLPRLADDGSS